MSALVLIALLAPDPVVARPCSSAEVATLTAPVAADAPAVRLTCFAALPPGASIRRRVVLEGAEASGAGLDCNGGSVGVPDLASNTREPTIAVWSRREGARWSVPSDVRITRCTIHGNLRVWGLGRDDIQALRVSSRTSAHTAAAQAAAPSGLTLDNVTFVATGSIPLYVGPGVTGVRMTGGGFRGRSVSTAIYLDAESAGAVIRNVAFDIRTGREQIAVDGSARNRIEGNRFHLNGRGGVFLYRNCGEDGVVRHQTPSDNVITGNRFEGAAWLTPRPVVIGSREGRRRYCGDDAGYPFGSSADNRDRATGNIVSDNTTGFRGLPSPVQAGRGAVRPP
ncbi:right-handed parallel beta-helix repeat-containing protein [Brevundimonas sp.]|uniref:right-handed parallel beta-helix repeat-containing protein n=1 Tax=Brevundimonas sp. TaxID=1871086 RepID=UPI00286D1789|nr:right-handed parallel beta-helix repeat-containing protein [Brevundimonas sp.]